MRFSRTWRSSTGASPRRADPDGDPAGSVTHRDPVLFPAPLGGLAISSARTRRVTVDPDGRLVITESGAVVDVVATARQVDRMVYVARVGLRAEPRWRPTATQGLVGLLEGERVVAVLNLSEWLPEPPASPRAGLVSSGLEALAARLGLAVEVASEVEARRVRRSRRRVISSRAARLGPNWSRIVVSATATLLAVAAFTDLTGASAATSLGVGLLVASILVQSLVVVPIVRERRRFHALATMPPKPDGRRVVAPILDPAAGGVADSRIQVDAHHIVVHDRGFELWLPGPDRGGVTQVARSARGVHLRDDRDHDLLVLDPAIWGEDLDLALQAAGTTRTRLAASTDGRYGLFSAGPPGRESTPRTARMEFEDTGGGHLSVVPLAGIAAWGTFLVALLAATIEAQSPREVLGPLLLLPLAAAVHPLAIWRAWWPQRRWDRRQRSRIPTNQRQGPVR